MKFLQLIILSAVLLISVPVLSQEPDSIEITYDITLLPTGTINAEGDSLYQVEMVVDTVDLQLLSEVDLESATEMSQLDVPSSDPSSDARIRKDKKRYRMDMYTFKDVTALKAKGKAKDGRKVKMKRSVEREKGEQDVRPAGRRSLKLAQDTIVPEEENQ